MPCPDHVVLLKATAQDVRRETACGLPALFRLLPATTRSSTKVVITSILISDAGGQCEIKQRLLWTSKRVVAAHYKKTTASNVPIVAIDVTTSLSLTGNRDWVLCIEYEVFI